MQKNNNNIIYFDHHNDAHYNKQTIVVILNGTEELQSFVVPRNVFFITVTMVAGGAAGHFPKFQDQLSGQGGCAGQCKTWRFCVQPRQTYYFQIGRGGYVESIYSKYGKLTRMQIEQRVYRRVSGTDTKMFDSDAAVAPLAVAKAELGFCGGKCVTKENESESGIASRSHNGGKSFKDANGYQLGLGGGGGGGKYGGAGADVISGPQTTAAHDAKPKSGCGGGGSALLLSGARMDSAFLPGKGASGYVRIEYQC